MGWRIRRALKNKSPHSCETLILVKVVTPGGTLQFVPGSGHRRRFPERFDPRWSPLSPQQVLLPDRPSPRPNFFLATFLLCCFPMSGTVIFMMIFSLFSPHISPQVALMVVQAPSPAPAVQEHRLKAQCVSANIPRG